MRVGSRKAQGLPWQPSSKESACQCRRHEFNPWIGKIPRRGKWQPTPAFLPGKSHGQRSLVDCKRVRHNLVTTQQQQGSLASIYMCEGEKFSLKRYPLSGVSRTGQEVTRLNGKRDKGFPEWEKYKTDTSHACQNPEISCSIAHCFCGFSDHLLY